MDKKKLKLLIVEDDTFLANMYKTKFGLEGYTVSLAESGEEALKMLRKEMPDLVLLDVLLPGMDGFNVLKKIKKTAEFKKVPVILLTNLGQKDDVRKGFEMGAIGYLIKAQHMPSEVVDKVIFALKETGMKV